MSRLNSTLNDEVINGIHEVLADAGIEEKPVELDEEVELSHIQKVFKSRGAGLAAAASNLASLMNSEKEEIQIRATEIALKANGVYADSDKKKQVPAVTINIMGSGGDQNTLINLVMPAAS